MAYQRRNPPAGNQGAPSKSTTADTSNHSGVAAWKRRRADARRLAILDCGCSDPWPCRCSEPPLTDRLINGGRDAALHLLEAGRVPLLELEVLQALWRRGGSDRELAELLHRLTAGAIA